MHYFIYGAAIAAVEDDTQAQRYAAAGWQVATHDEFIAAWRRRDQASMPAPQPDTRHRIVGALPGVAYPFLETGL